MNWTLRSNIAIQQIDKIPTELGPYRYIFQTLDKILDFLPTDDISTAKLRVRGA